MTQIILVCSLAQDPLKTELERAKAQDLTSFLFNHSGLKLINKYKKRETTTETNLHLTKTLLRYPRTITDDICLFTFQKIILIVYKVT